VALLRDANPKNASGGYERLFGNAELGQLASRMHSTVISAGGELERMIKALVPEIPDLDAFLQRDPPMPEGVFLVSKTQLKKSTKLASAGAEPDFMIFRHREGRQACHVVELKDGHMFDTKKASGEQEAMSEFVKQNSPHIPYRVQCHFCAFNQESKTAIWEGFKKKIKLEEAMTGREFCELLEIDYDEIVAKRQADGPTNLDYFLSELVKIPAVRNRLRQLLG